jgi:hypothetical protein
MKTAFVIGNGESRNIFPIEHLKHKGIVYGCNAIYRDHPWLCDKIVSVNEEMYQEVKRWSDFAKPKGVVLHGPKQLSPWNFSDGLDDAIPRGLKLYRMWRGGSMKQKYGNKIKTVDFSEAKGSGCSATLLAAESGAKKVVILGFDILGAQQWEMQSISRIQNNCYKNTVNYPQRESMKAYLKYEWMYQLRQTFRKFSDTQFYYINRREYINANHYLPYYFNLPNIRLGIYADLQRWINGQQDDIKWIKY